MIGVNNQNRVLIAGFKLNILLEVFPVAALYLLSDDKQGHKMKLLSGWLVSLRSFSIF